MTFQGKIFKNNVEKQFKIQKRYPALTFSHLYLNFYMVFFMAEWLAVNINHKAPYHEF